MDYLGRQNVSRIFCLHDDKIFLKTQNNRESKQIFLN